jgi:hypothetical protein
LSEAFKVDLSKLNPVASWEGGSLRIYLQPRTSAKLEPPEDYAPYGLGHAIPHRVAWTEPDGVQLQLELIGGVLRVVGVQVGDLPDDPHTRRARELAAQTGRRQKYERLPWLSGAYLRGLPIDKISRQAAMAVVVRLYRRPGSEVIGIRAHEAYSLEALEREDLSILVGAEAQVFDETKRRLSLSRPRRGRRPVPRERIEQAAAIAWQAERDGESPDSRISEQMHVALSTAKKYRRLARNEGLLPASTGQGAKGPRRGGSDV